MYKGIGLFHYISSWGVKFLVGGVLFCFFHYTKNNAHPSFSGWAQSIMVHFEAISVYFQKIWKKQIFILVPVFHSHFYYPLPLLFMPNSDSTYWYFNHYKHSRMHKCLSKLYMCERWLLQPTKEHQEGICLSKMLVLDGFLSEYYDSFLGLNTIWDSLFSLLLQVGWVYQGLFLTLKS